MLAPSFKYVSFCLPSLRLNITANSLSAFLLPKCQVSVFLLTVFQPNGLSACSANYFESSVSKRSAHQILNSSIIQANEMSSIFSFIYPTKGLTWRIPNPWQLKTKSRQHVLLDVYTPQNLVDYRRDFPLNRMLIYVPSFTTWVPYNDLPSQKARE